MQPFVQHRGLVAPLDRDNVDTDAIIPKQFMKSIARTGFGQYLFDEWRYNDAGFYGKAPADRVTNPDFVLNAPRYAGASILLTGRNFGCGSSREHAPWALQQYGFRALIASSFADIFFNNCCKNGVLPVVLDDRQVGQLLDEVLATPGYQLAINLAAQEVTAPSNLVMHFQLPPLLKTRLLDGTDELGATLRRAPDIKAFEVAHLKGRPWL